MLGRGDTGQRRSLPDSEAWALNNEEEGPKPGDEGGKDWGFQQPPESPLAAFPRRAQPFGKELEVGGHTPLWLDIVQIQKASEVPWLPLVKTPCFYYRGNRFHPWSGN